MVVVKYTIGVLALSVAVLLSASSTQADTVANKDLVRRFNESTNSADWDALSDIVADDFVRHSAATQGSAVTSREAFVQLQMGFLESFPDQAVSLNQLIAEGDRVAVLGTYRGTNTGPVNGAPATGRAVESPFLGIFRIEDGRIAELWVEWDNVAILTQLGMFPPPQPGGSAAN